MARIPEPVPFELAVDDDGDAWALVDCPSCGHHSRRSLEHVRPGETLRCSCGVVIATFDEGSLATVRADVAEMLGAAEEP